MRRRTMTMMTMTIWQWIHWERTTVMTVTLGQLVVTMQQVRPTTAQRPAAAMATTRTGLQVTPRSAPMTATMTSWMMRTRMTSREERNRQFDYGNNERSERARDGRKGRERKGRMEGKRVRVNFFLQSLLLS
ncbi:hypothetical protein BKA57DRAFT_11397 [Linnemannia elongata]|nr:hypothetical protein BKA57DRAFT_11397 [Linnemannia elongata]